MRFTYNFPAVKGIQAGREYFISMVQVYCIAHNRYDFTFTKTPETTRSVHIEYDYKKRGDALDIVYNNETYFVFPLDNQSNLTKYHFATEEIYKKAVSEN